MTGLGTVKMGLGGGGTMKQQGWGSPIRWRYLSLYWKIRPGGETECYSEESVAYGGGGVREVSDFNKQDTQSDKDVTPLRHTLSLRQCEARPGQSPTLPHFLPSCTPPTPSPHLSPPIPLLFRFISMKNNESKHLEPRLH